MNKGILLLGAGGQLGSEWHNYLKHSNFKFRACFSSDVNVTDTGSLDSVITDYRPEIVINCAAYTDVDLAEDEPEKARKINADAVGNMAMICEKNHAKLIHYSSDYVFPGNSEDRKRLPLGYPETYPPGPVNTYGHTKWEGEQLIEKQCTDFIIIRVSWLSGIHGNNFIKTMLRLSQERAELRVVNDQFGAPAFTDNVLKNTMTLIQSGYRGVIHASSSGLTTWHDIAAAIFEKKKIETRLIPISTSEYPTKAARPLYSRLDISRLKNIPGVQIITWEEGLDDLLNQIR